jgi:O-antigen/teichoic acid export membrane protein
MLRYLARTMGDPATPSGAGPRAALTARLGPISERLRGSGTATAAGLAGAMIATNVIALGSTIAFSRILDDYGALAALVSTYLILTVAGQALQVAVAREGVLGHLGVGPALTATLRSWTRSLLLLTVALAVVSVLLRHPIADAIGVKKEPWAAAVALPAGSLFLLVSVLRGALQSIGAFKEVGFSLVGEQTARLVLGAALAAGGLNVTGAYLGTPLSLLAMCAYCGWHLHRRLAGPRVEHPARHLMELVRGGWAAIAGLAIIAMLQNIDVIAAKHQFSKDVASSYAAAAVAAKVLIWVAMGVGFYLVPETSRRASEGRDTRPVLARTVALIAIVSIPVLAIFAGVPHLLLKVGFGEKRTLVSGSLILLGTAFTVLAVTYLAIQYLLALHRSLFLVLVGAVAVAEPLLLFFVAPNKPNGFAAFVLLLQGAAALLAFPLALRRGRPGRSSPGISGAPTPDAVA